MKNLILIGASVRAAAFSALRSGLNPICVDLFADADLQAHWLTKRISAHQYPFHFEHLLANVPNTPLMYTGALENHPALIRRLAQQHPLWGNSASVLKQVRSPLSVAEALENRQLPSPLVIHPFPSRIPAGDWVCKPVHGCGGNHIRFADHEQTTPEAKEKWYLQEYITGATYAAIYLANNDGVELLGITRQLVGQTWLNAEAFQYCASIGPIALSPRQHSRYLDIGEALTEAFALRGIFGVDFVVRDEQPFTVEVNPRYTASVEVLEHALRTPILQRHVRSFGVEDAGELPTPNPVDSGEVIGKAVIFAPATFQFTRKILPSFTDWTLDNPWRLPTFADIPQDNSKIEKGSPILTIFAKAADEKNCVKKMRQTADALLQRIIFSSQ